MYTKCQDHTLRCLTEGELELYGKNLEFNAQRQISSFHFFYVHIVDEKAICLC